MTTSNVIQLNKSNNLHTNNLLNCINNRKDETKLYTLEEAKELLDEQARIENEQLALQKSLVRRERAYFAKQKLIGFSLIMLAIVLMLVVKDATASFFMIPIGIMVMLTKSKVITE